MNTEISLPDSVLDDAEILAQQLRLSRRELGTKALQADLKHHDRTQTRHSR